MSDIQRSGPLLVPQRVQAVRPGQPGAAELPDPRLERLRRLPDQARAQRVPQRTRPAGSWNSAAGCTPPRTPAPPPRSSTPCTRASTSGSRCAARSIPTACSPPTWPDVWSCCKWCFDADGNPQTILLLGGTSEIGLAICERYLRNAHARVVLADLPDDPGRDDAVAQMKAAGAKSVELHRLRRRRHREPSEGDRRRPSPAAMSTWRSSRSACSATPRSCGRTSARPCRSPKSTTPQRFRWACCSARRCGPRASGRSSR